MTPPSRLGPDGCNGTSKQGIPPRNNRWLAKTHDATAYLGALIRSKRRMLLQSRPKTYLEIDLFAEAERLFNK